MCAYIENNDCSWKHSLVPDGDQGQRTGGEPLFTELPRRRVFSETQLLSLLHPAAHPPLVGQVLLPKGAFQITLLTLDHLALDYVQHQRQEEDGPQSVPKNGYPGVEYRQGEIAGVSAPRGFYRPLSRFDTDRKQ